MKLGMKLAARLRNNVYLLGRKLKEQCGASEYFATLVLIIIVLVVGGILIGLVSGTFKEVWETVKTRIMDLFNYA